MVLADGISSSNVSHIASESAVKSLLTDYYLQVGILVDEEFSPARPGRGQFLAAFADKAEPVRL